MKKYCKYCGKELKSKSNRSLFCNKDCKKDFDLKLPIKRIIKCEYCGKNYDYVIGQPNWSKNGLKEGKGLISSRRFCCYECGWKDKSNRMKNTCLEKYGYISALSDIKKRENGCLLKLGVSNPSKSKIIINKRQSTCLKKYGKKNYVETDDFKQQYKNTSLNNFGTINPMQNLNVKQKVRDSKKKNKTFGKSKSEDQIYQLLLQKFNKVERQYKSEQYPFACDFYIPSIDLYIEYQGFYTHGPQCIPGNKNIKKCHEPFNKNNKNHILALEELKKLNYNNIIIEWTIRDPLKRKIAKENNLNFIEFFNMEEFYEWYNKE